MVINVIQTKSEGTSEFQVMYNNQLRYIAKTPFIHVNGPINLESSLNTKIFDLNANEIYHTEYRYYENLKEETKLLKHLKPEGQKF